MAAEVLEQTLKNVLSIASARRYADQVKACRSAVEELEALKLERKAEEAPEDAGSGGGVAPASSQDAEDTESLAEGALVSANAQDGGAAEGEATSGFEVAAAEADEGEGRGAQGGVEEADVGRDGVGISSAGVEEDTAVASPAPEESDLERLSWDMEAIIAGVPALCGVCETLNSRLVEIVLKCFTELVAKGYLEGSVHRVEVEDSSRVVAVISRILKAVGSAHEVPDESIEQHLVRLLLYMTASRRVCLHGEALLLVVRSCYNVFLGTRSEQNQVFAKGCLMQTVNVVFSRAEAGSIYVATPPVQLPAPKESSTAAEVHAQYAQDLLNTIVQNCEVMRAGQSGEGGGGEAPVALSADSKDGEGSCPLEPCPLAQDAYLVFRSLCKLSMKSQGDGQDAFLLRGKVLSLELLQQIVNNSGAVLCGAPKFLVAIKQFLCLSLLKNCSNSDAEIAQLVLSIFWKLLQDFRSQLKSEVGVFFPMIFCHPLDGAGGGVVADSLPQPMPYSRLITLLRWIEKVGSDGQLLADLFVNYDCELEGVSVFERTVAGLARIAQGIFPSDVSSYMTKEQIGSLTFQSLQCLVTISQTLTDSFGYGAESVGTLDQDVEGPESILINDGDDVPASSPFDGKSSAETEKVEQQRAYKKEFQHGIKLFNKKPKKGVAYMLEKHMIEGGSEGVADFLRNVQGLWKTAIGEYLGDGDDECVKVMHSFVDAQNFSGLSISGALRKFLSDFRLPGEAQKIDRLMLKFADRYSACCPDVFKNADTCYVLAYSIIMLNTDQHNPQVKKKMTLEEFVKNNRGIDDGEDLPEESLGNIFKDISENEIKMKGSSGTVKQEQAKASALDGLFALFGTKTAVVEVDEDVIRSTHEEMNKDISEWKSADPRVNSRPMLEVAWAPMLGVFSVLFEDNIDLRLSSLCLQGFKNVIVMAAELQMETVRDAYVTALAKFTLVHAPVRMRVKNAEAFQTLLSAAEEAGNHLHRSWDTVLNTISIFDGLYQAQLVQKGQVVDDVTFKPQKSPEVTPQKSSGRPYLFQMTPPPAILQNRAASQREQESLPLPPAGVLESIDVSSVGKLFLMSERLDSVAIVDFVQSLTRVSLVELCAKTPRVFSLTKIVETAHVNMRRIRIVWSRIWAVLSDYFIDVGLSENLSVAMYAVDSLRQLAMKFLEHDELANYTFQNEFLRPFVIVMRRSTSSEIRELIIRCVSQFVLARVENVKSGWKSLFMVFKTAASDSSAALVALAFETIEKVVREYFEHITGTETSTFTDCVNCLIAFANSPLTEVSLNAISFLQFCGTKLGEGKVGELQAPEDADIGAVLESHKIKPLDGQPEASTEPTSGSSAPGETAPLSARSDKLFTDKDVDVYFWFPLLAGLSELTFDGREAIRQRARKSLFDILQFHGHTFSVEFWNRIFESVLFPIFDNVRAEIIDATTFVSLSQKATIDTWLFETCSECLHDAIDLFVNFFSVVKSIFPKMLQLLVGFMSRGHRDVSPIGAAALFKLLQDLGGSMDATMWDLAIEHLVMVVNTTMPNLKRLFPNVAPEAGTHGGGNANRRSSLTSGSGARRFAEIKCCVGVQRQIVKGIAELCCSDYDIGDQHTLAILGSLEDIQDHATKVDLDVELRSTIQALQQEEDVSLEGRIQDPPLIELEMEASQGYLATLQVLLNRGDKDLSDGQLTDKFVQAIIHNLKTFQGNAKVAGSTEAEQRASLAVTSLVAVMSMGDSVFKPHVRELFPILTELIAFPSATREILESVSVIFSEKVNPLLCE